MHMGDTPDNENETEGKVVSGAGANKVWRREGDQRKELNLHHSLPYLVAYSSGTLKKYIKKLTRREGRKQIRSKRLALLTINNGLDIRSLAAKDHSLVHKGALATAPVVLL